MILLPLVMVLSLLEGLALFQLDTEIGLFLSPDFKELIKFLTFDTKIFMMSTET